MHLNLTRGRSDITQLVRSWPMEGSLDVEVQVTSEVVVPLRRFWAVLEGRPDPGGPWVW